MKKILFALSIFVLTTSCASSVNTTVSNGVYLPKYQYIVFGNEDSGDADLADIIMMVQNELSDLFIVASPLDAIGIIKERGYVLSPKISIKSEKWDGGHTYISISFYDYATNRMVAVVKSSGIGLSVSHDQEIALSAIKKELNRVFK